MKVAFANPPWSFAGSIAYGSHKPLLRPELRAPKGPGTGVSHFSETQDQAPLPLPEPEGVFMEKVALV